MRAWFRSHPRWRRFVLYWAPSLFVAWLLLGFFGVPLIARKWLVPKLNQELEGTLTLRECSFNPFTWRTVLKGAEVRDKQGVLVLAAERIDANAEMWRTIFCTGWHLSELKVQRPYVYGAVMADGVPNLRKLRKVAPPRDPSLGPQEPLKKIPRLVVDVCSVEDGEFHLADESAAEAVRLDWVGLSFAVDRIDTDPLHNNPHTCTAHTATGEKLTWTGKVYVNPLSSTGSLKLEDLDLVRFQPYVDRFAAAKLVGGKVTVEMTYEFAPVREPRKAVATISSVLLRGLKLDQDDLHALDLPVVRLSNVAADAVARTLKVESVEVEGGSIAARREKTGVVSLAGLLKSLPASEAKGAGAAASGAPPAPRQDPTTIPYPLVRLLVATGNLIDDAAAPWTVELTALQTRDVTAVWIDDALRAPQKIEATKVALALGPVRTDDRYRLPVKVTADLLGGRGVASGSVEPMGIKDGAPISTRLDLEGVSLDLSALAPYLPAQPLTAFPAADLRSGVLTAKGTLLAGLSEQAQLSWDGQATVTALGFDGADTTRVLGATSITATGHSQVTAGADVSLTHSGRIAAEKLQGRPILVGPSRFAVGSLIVDGESTIAAGSRASLRHTGPVVVSGVEAEGPITAGDGGQPCELALETLTLEGALEVTAGDRLTALHDGSLSTTRVAVEGPIAGPMSLALAGTSLSGRVELRDGMASANGRGSVQALELTADELAGPVTLKLDSATIEGSVQSDTTKAPTPATQAGSPAALVPPTTGTLNLVLGKLSAEAPRVAQTKVQWDGFRIDGLVLDTVARSMTSRSVTLTNPTAEIAATIIPREEGKPLPPGTPPTLSAADLRHIKPLIDRLAVYSFSTDAARIDGGTLHAVDPASQPPIDARIEGIEAQVTGFSTDMSRPLAIHYACKVAGSGKVNADGTIDLSSRDNAKANGTVVLTAVPVVPFSAAPGHFLGYLATDGRISTNIPVSLSNDTMKGELKLLLDRFTLGDATNSPAAPSVPIKFGLAILEDRNGQIDVSIPFEGKITDPGFTVGGLVWKVIVNLITKAATAPFTLIGGLFGGGSDTDLSQIAFEPGAAELTPQAISTLDSLSRALTERPGLNLAVRGVVAEETDTAALKQRKLRSMLAAKANLQNAALLTDAELRQQTILAHRGLAQPQQAPTPPGAQEPTVEAMTEALLAQVQVTPHDLATLRAARADSVVEFLSKEKQIPASRVKAADPKPDATAPADKPAALFELF